MNTDEAKKIIKDTVTKSIKDYAKKSISKKAKFQILDLIIPKERKIRSIVGGLETSLGTTLWEPLAKALARENGFTVIKTKLNCPTNMPAALGSTLQMIIEDRKKGAGLFDASSSHASIKRVCQAFIERPIESFERPPKGRGVDIWLEKDGVNYFFDTKTVQPNLSALTSCLEQVLSWYSYYYSKNPIGKAEGRIVFPYNPYVGSVFWDKTIGNGRPLERDNEAWVENQFWDFCSGLDNTFEIIMAAFNELVTEGTLERDLDALLRSDGSGDQVFIKV